MTSAPTDRSTRNASARRLARYSMLLAMAVVGILFVLATAYFFRGSLEEFPTDEQIDKVRRVSAVGATMLLVVEIGLWSLLRRLTRTHQ